MKRTQVERLPAEANPVATPPPGRVTATQERLLSSIAGVPAASPRRRLGGAARLVVATSAVAVVALAVVLVAGRDAGVRDEVEATTPGAIPATSGEGELIHVVTRLYGTIYGPGLGERLDGWLEPSTGRVRIVITTADEMTLQQVVGADDHVRSWQGALGNVGGVITDDRVAPRLAANLRALVRDRMSSLVEFASDGFKRDNAFPGPATSEQGEYRGRPVTIHRVAPTVAGGAPSGFYYKWYVDPTTQTIIAFERGPVGTDRKDVVDQGEELEKLETFPPGEAPMHELDWESPEAPPGATPTPTPAQLP
jgi:hypothetical protein